MSTGKNPKIQKPRSIVDSNSVQDLQHFSSELEIILKQMYGDMDRIVTGLNNLHSKTL